MKKIITIIAVIALLAVLGTVLFACVPSDPSKAKEKLKKAGYDVEIDTVDEYIAAYLGKPDGAKKYLFAEDEDDDDEYIYALYFESSSKAKAYYKDHKDDKQYSDLKTGQSGKWVYAGTEAAVKAFKK